MAKQATDTFVATLADGTERRVVRGEVLPDNHPVVKHAPLLFGDFESAEAAKPAAKTARKAVR